MMATLRPLRRNCAYNAHHLYLIRCPVHQPDLREVGVQVRDGVDQEDAHVDEVV